MTGGDELQIIGLSLKVALWGVAWSLPLAVATALALSRGRFFGKTLFDAAVHLPLVLPPVVVGFALLAVRNWIAGSGIWAVTLRFAVSAGFIILGLSAFRAGR